MDTDISTQDLVLGFDAREMCIESRLAWDEARREEFLLRKTVRKPLSVDAFVWPSIFGRGLPPSERRRLSLETMQVPEWKGPNAGLWADLNQMRGTLGG